MRIVWVCGFFPIRTLSTLATLILIFSTLTSHKTWAQDYSIVQKGMEAHLDFAKPDQLTINLLSPNTPNTKGWFMIGFNTPNQPRPLSLSSASVFDASLQNARLFFVRLDKQIPLVQEYRTDFSNPHPFHRPVSNLGVEVLSTSKDEEWQSVRFKIALQGKHLNQVDLGKDKTIVVSLAYANDYDFNHHSMMRTHQILHLKH